MAWLSHTQKNLFNIMLDPFQILPPPPPSPPPQKKYIFPLLYLLNMSLRFKVLKRPVTLHVAKEQKCFI